MAVTRQHLVAWFAAWQRVYAENRQRLTDLDAAIGDADHGTNMDRGFTAVRVALAEPPGDLAGVLHAAAGVLIRTVGGASGPLFGTFFLRAAATCAGKEDLDAAALVTLFEAGIAGVAERGKAQAGDKTMIDALLPAAAAMRTALERGEDIGSILRAGAKAAEQGMLSTIPMQARKGRASYLGERSVGHQDPGATSAWLLLQAAADHA
jgi:dihydroxyacetone kinase-like protein